MTQPDAEQCSVLSIGGEMIELLPERAAYWPARGTLIAADLHLGKCETLRAAGLPIPPGVVGRDLARLAVAVQRTGAARILVVGDLIHHGSGLSAGLVDLVRGFFRRELAHVSVHLVPGNHDRQLEFLAHEWGVFILGKELLEPPFGFAHDPGHGLVPGAAVTWFGHVHPLCRVGTRASAVSVPCFVIDRDHVLLPAFSQFTAGIAVPLAPTARAYAIAEGEVLAVPALRGGRGCMVSCLGDRPG